MFWLLDARNQFQALKKLEFTAMLDQLVQTQITHLNEKYERFTVDYKELH
jgi:hypothetical protein